MPKYSRKFVREIGYARLGNAAFIVLALENNIGKRLISPPLRNLYDNIKLNVCPSLLTKIPFFLKIVQFSGE